MRARIRTGSVVLDKRIKRWNFLYWQDRRHHSKTIGTLRDLPTKADAWRAAKPLRDALERAGKPVVSNDTAPTVKTLVEQYRQEKMPKRYSTSRSYGAWFRNRILPQWGDHPITDLQARPVELWLQPLPLAGRSKSSIRGLLSILWDYAMWRGDVSTQRNPMELVSIKGATKRKRRPRSLTVGEFQKFIQHLADPFRTIALVCVCFGLRISECLGLKWSDIDWLSCTLNIERGIVRQRVDDVKSVNSGRKMTIDDEMLEVLKLWKQATEFRGDGDWIFASPLKLGRLPYSADAVNDAYLKAAKAAGIGGVSTHTMRHTYRSWLDAVGTAIAVQQKLMRHADIRTTMNVYGDVVTDEMAQAHRKVVGLALSRA